jgi:hypothetical protein
MVICSLIIESESERHHDMSHDSYQIHTFCPLGLVLDLTCNAGVTVCIGKRRLEQTPTAYSI